MSPEARKVVRDAKRGLKRCMRMHAELNDRIARLHQIDLEAASAENAGQLKHLLEMMQAVEHPRPTGDMPEAA